MKLTITRQLDAQRIKLWNSLWIQSPRAHPRQHPAFAQLEERLGRTVLYALAEENDQARAVGCVSISPILGGPAFFREAVCKRGPVFDDPDIGRSLIEAIADHCRTLGVARLHVSPYWLYPEAERVETMLAETNFDPSGRYRSAPEPTAILDLTRNDDDLLAGFSKKLRYQIRQAAKRGIVIEPVRDLSDIETHHHAYELHQRARGLTPISREEYRATHALFNEQPDLGVLLQARYGSTPLAHLWLLSSGHTLHAGAYALAPADQRADLPPQLSLGPILWWEAVRWGKAYGCSIFNFEGYVEPEEADPALREVFAFKKKFRPEPARMLSDHARPVHGMLDASLTGWRFCRHAVEHVRRRLAA